MQLLMRELRVHLPDEAVEVWSNADKGVLSLRYSQRIATYSVDGSF